MKVGLFEVKSGKSNQYFDIYKKILDYNNIDYKTLDYNLKFWEEVVDIDFYIHRYIGTDHDIYIANSILPVVENILKIPCYPNFNTYWCYEDKIKEYFLMETNKFPMVKSFIFFDKSEAINWVEKNKEFPIIFKLKSGAGSINVIKVNSLKNAKKLIKKMFNVGVKDQGIPSVNNIKYFNYRAIKKYFGSKILTKLGLYNSWPVWQIHKNYVLFQEFMPNNEFDTRITTIGNRAFAFRRMNRKNDFRSSGSGIIDYDINYIDLNCVKIALEISKKMKFQSMAYDFLLDNNKKPVFCEISYTFNDKAIYNCRGYWDENLFFNEGNFWPQYFQIMDLLNFVELKQPMIQ